MSVTRSKIVFWLAMLLALTGSFFIFKDLADISQWVVQSPRAFTMAVWHYRYPLCAVSVVMLLLATWVWLRQRRVCRPWLFTILVLFFCINVYSGMLNPALMFRPQQDKATMVGIDEAAKHLEKTLGHAHFGNGHYDSVDDIEVLVVETDDGAYAFSDYYLLQPHVANAGTVDGKKVVMTYCGLTNLGVAYRPVIDGKPLHLRAITQLKNNLVLADADSGKPIQQIWGRMEGAPAREAMTQVASIRMPFGSFRQLYPGGKVFINDIASFSQNPVLALWDRIVRNGMMLWGVGMQWDNPDKPAFPTIKHFDPRLPMKQLVYAVNIGGDYVAYTKDFIRKQGGVINVTIGGQPAVSSYDDKYDVVTAWHNAESTPVTAVDVFGKTADGRQLTRINTLKSKLFWFIFAEFYPSTDVNRA